VANQTDPIGVTVSSTGQVGTGTGYLSVHYASFRPEYEAMLRSVGIRPGWRVLDAGCGGGDFLPLLAALVGAAGSIVAIDLAPDNVATVQEQLAGWALPCPVEAQAGSVTALPFPADAFDAVWCANTLMYLAADEADTALREFGRVTKPGGLVANKEIEAGLMLLAPAPPFLFPHYWERRGASSPLGRALVRARILRQSQRHAGLVETWQRTTLIERWSPVSAVERGYLGGTLAYFAEAAEEAGVPAEDLPTWRRLRDADAPGYLLDDPDFYYCEANVVAVGRVPTTCVRNAPSTRS